jgi:hypothetical protein
MKTKQTDKDFVGLGVHVCPVCLKEHDEVVLVDTHMRPILKKCNFAGWKLCDEHEKLWMDGYIALIECANESTPTLETANRTGRIAHVRKEAWTALFNMPVPKTPIAFVQQGVVEKLQGMIHHEVGESET